MKLRFSKSLLVKTGTILLFAAVIFIIHSCRKDIKSSYQDITDPEIQNAMDWYNQAYPVQNQSLPNTTTLFSSMSTAGVANHTDLSRYTGPDWHHTTKYSRYNNNVIEMPVDPEHNLKAVFQNSNTGKIGSKKYTKSSYLVIKDAGIYHAFIMTIIADSSYIENDTTKLSRNTYFKHESNFSGLIVYQTAKGDFLSAYRYADGLLLTGSSPSSDSGKPAVQTIDGGTYTCTDWFMYNYVNSELVSVMFLYHTCTYNGNGGGNNHTPELDGGGGSGGSTPDGCPTGYVPASVIKVNVIDGPVPDAPFPSPIPHICRLSIIEDSLKKNFPCATKLIVDSLKNIPAYHTFIQPFTSNSSPNLSWQNGILPWNATNAQDTSRRTYTLGETDPRGYSSTITLNTLMLQNSTPLIIAAASIHETLHAYLNYYIYWDHALRGNGVPDSLARDSWLGSLDSWASLYGLPTNYSNHNQMLGGYFDKMVNILSTWDNNGHTLQEYRMSMMYGLNNGSDGSRAQQDSLKAFYSRTKTKYAIADTTINKFYKQQLNASPVKRLPGDCN